MELKVENIRPEVKVSFREVESVYSINYSGIKNRFLKRVLTKAIDYLKSKHIITPYTVKEEVKTCSTVTLNVNDLVNSIQDELIYFTSRNITIDTIIIGADYLAKLVHQVPQEFIYLGDHPKIRGAKLVLNPYINGVVFMPRGYNL